MPKSNSFKEELKKLEGMLNRLSTKKIVREGWRKKRF